MLEKWTETKPLYLVEFRKTRHYTTEQLAGVSDAEVVAADWASDGRGSYWAKGHDAGSLRDRYPLPVLTWRVSAGDRVILIVPVRIDREVTIESYDDAPDKKWVQMSRPTQARYDEPTMFDERLTRANREVFVRLRTSVPFARSLGDDSDPHEPTDALREAVQCYLDGDERAAQVELVLEPVPDGYEYKTTTLLPTAE